MTQHADVHFARSSLDMIRNNIPLFFEHPDTLSI